MAITLVQAAGPATGTSLTTLNVTITATGAGNTLVVCVSEAADGATNPNITGITLGGSATGWAAAETSLSNSACNTEIWYCPGIAGGQTALVITMGNGAGNAVACAYVYEVSGLSGVVDKVAGAVNTTGSTTAVSSGATSTTASTAEFWAGIAYSVDFTSSQTFTAPGVWTNETQQAQTFGTNFAQTISGYQITVATGAATYSSTVTATNVWSAAVATFSPFIAGSGPPLDSVPQNMAAVVTGRAGWRGASHSR